MNEIEIAAYLDRRLDPGDVDRVENHLAGCDDCREEVVAVRGVLQRGRRRGRVLLGGSLAAAALLVLSVWPESPPLLRNGPAGTALVAHGPLGEVPPGVPTFAWGPAPGATAYRLTLSGSNGVLMWSGTTADTMMQLSDSVSIRAGSTYYWIADALLADGTTRSTGLREFRPRR